MWQFTMNWSLGKMSMQRIRKNKVGGLDKVWICNKTHNTFKTLKLDAILRIKYLNIFFHLKKKLAVGILCQDLYI